jgi:hypothetical protein
MSNTSLILRDPKTPKIRVLESDGPNLNSDPIINYSPRVNLPPMTFEQWVALPDYERNPRYSNPSNQDYESACRISRLIAAHYNGFRCRRHTEIQARLELLFPGCTGEILRTQPNLQSA